MSLFSPKVTKKGEEIVLSLLGTNVSLHLDEPKRILKK